MDGESLASPNDSDGGGTGMGHFHIERFGERCRWIGDEGDDGIFDLLVFSPCLHCDVV